MNIPMFRTLNADEIECRVQTVTDKGCSLLLYKNARCDMSILDETVGPMNWMRRHERDNANCVVSIWDSEKGQWISKEDTGTESDTEAEKGIASDSFKRACTNWGIGRELYTAPFIWIKAKDIEWKENSKGKKVPKNTFTVWGIGYDDKRKINMLTIKRNDGETVFRMGVVKKPEQIPEEPILCPICNKPVQPGRSNGKEVVPLDVLKKLGGMCKDCYRKMNANESTNS